MQRLHDLFLKIWQDGDAPQDFKDATIVTVYKKKVVRQSVATTEVSRCCVLLERS